MTNFCSVYTPVGLDKVRNISAGQRVQTCTWRPTPRPWYKQSAKDRVPRWTSPYLDLWTGHFCVTHTVPVFAPNGDVFGVQGIDVRIDHMGPLLRSAISASFKNSSDAYSRIQMHLVHKSGNLVSRILILLALLSPPLTTNYFLLVSYFTTLQMKTPLYVYILYGKMVLVGW